MALSPVAERYKLHGPDDLSRQTLAIGLISFDCPATQAGLELLKLAIGHIYLYWMILMADAALERYVELKRQISKLENELDDLKDSIFKSVDTAGGKIAAEGYVLKTQKRPKYKYSDEYETKNKELKELKKEEVKNGTAVIDGYSEFVTLKFKD